MDKKQMNWQQIMSNEDPNRTIRIVPKTIVMEKDSFLLATMNVLKQFGEVESTNYRYIYCPILGLDYVLVQLKDDEVAHDLMNQGRIIIQNVECIVKPLNGTDGPFSENSPMERLLPPPSQDSPDNIINALNDDCLRLVFEKIHHWRDIIAVTFVCKRFERIAEATFPSVIRRKGVRIEKQDLELLELHDFLRAFGWSVLSAKCCNLSGDLSNIVLQMINYHCGNVNDLQLPSVFDISHDTVFNIRPLLSKLRHLSMETYEQPVHDFISHCYQLETLQLKSAFQDESTLPAITFPNLINFKLLDTDGIACPIEDFLLSNPQIEELEIPYKAGLGHLIAEDMPNVRKVNMKPWSCRFGDSEMYYLRQIECFSLNCFTPSSLDLISNIYPLTNITNLEITWGKWHVHDLIELTKNLPRIKILTVDAETHEQSITTDILNKMLQNANQLQELNITDAKDIVRHFDENDYEEILKVVKRRSNHTKLSIKIQCETNVTTVLQDFDAVNEKEVRFSSVPELLNVQVTYEFNTRRPYAVVNNK